MAKTTLNLLPQYIIEKQKTKRLIIYVATLQVAIFLMYFIGYLIFTLWLIPPDLDNNAFDETLFLEANNLSATLIQTKSQLQKEDAFLSSLSYLQDTALLLSKVDDLLGSDLNLESISFSEENKITLMISTFEQKNILAFMDALHQEAYFYEIVLKNTKNKNDDILSGTVFSIESSYNLNN